MLVYYIVLYYRGARAPARASPAAPPSVQEAKYCSQ